MNKHWHESNPFPENASDDIKVQWRLVHKENCNCGAMLLPYRNKSRNTPKNFGWHKY